MIRTSFIIISWNGKGYLQQLLPSMSKQIQRSDTEIILVDNGSTDGTAEYVKDQFPTIQLIALPENKGVAAARNIALRLAQGDYLLILDNDIIVNDEAISGMETYMDSHPRVGLCACRLTYFNGETQSSYKDYPSITIKVRNVFFSQSNKQYHPIYVIGACQMIRKETFNQVGELDENIFYGPEDCDYCIRVKQQGWEVTYLPQYVLIHNCQRLTTKRPFSRLGRKHIQGLLYFYCKHRRLF